MKATRLTATQAMLVMQCERPRQTTDCSHTQITTPPPQMHSGERQQWKSTRNKSGGILAPARFSEWRIQNSGAQGLRVFTLRGSMAPHNWLSHPSTRPNPGEKRSARLLKAYFLPPRSVKRRGPCLDSATSWQYDLRQMGLSFLSHKMGLWAGQ